MSPRFTSWKKYNTDEASELVCRLYGPRTSSHGGTYLVWTEGLLHEIPHVRLVRGVVIGRTEDAERVVDFLEACGAEVHLRRVELTREDRETPRA